MLSKSFTLTQRGLRLDARQLRSHLLRVGAVLIVCLALFVIAFDALTTGAPGLKFFKWIIWNTFIVSTLAGGTYFATAITEEKEEQTIGLLTLANITPSALILGKFLPRLLSVLLILSAVFPFTLLSITLGGVLWNQVWAAYWSLLAHIVWMGSLGLFCSVVCRQSGTAIAATILGLIAFFAGPPLVQGVCSGLTSAGIGGAAVNWCHRAAASVAEASASTRLGEILQTGFNQGPFGWQVVCNLALSGTALLAAWLLFGPFNRAWASDTQRVSILERGIRLQRGSRRAWRWALIGKDFYHVAGGPTWWGVRIIVLVPLVVVFALAANGFRWDWDLRPAVGTACMGVALYAVVIELTIAAARLFRGEIKHGTWPNLAALPVSIAEIGYAKAAGSTLGCVPAVACFCLGMLIAPDVVGGWFASDQGGPLALASFMYWGAILLVFLHLTTLFSVLLNAWAGVLLAFLTMSVSSCFMSGAFILPVMILMEGTRGDGFGVIAVLGVMAVYGVVFLGICFGLEVLIAQRLKTLAGR